MGYPDDRVEVELLAVQKDRSPIESVEPVLDAARLAEIQKGVAAVYVHASLLRYIQRLVAATRADEHAQVGASPRGALALMRAAQALACVQGAPFVAPDHVKQLAVPVLAHRILVKSRSRVQGIDGAAVVGAALAEVDVPVDYEPV
jgi:MoxR-like ATPase